MKSVADHLADCLAVSSPLPAFTVTLHDSVGTILADNVRSLVDLPAADLAGRDGYAVRAADILGASVDAPVTLPVITEIRADSTDAQSIVEGACMKISSGAPMPHGADCVVPIEATDQGRAEVQIRATCEPGANVRMRAEDLSAGSIVLEAGVRIGSRQVAILASAGHSRVMVHPRPRVVIMSVGDELQEPGTNARRGRVFDANSHALASAVTDAGGDVFRVGAVPDDARELRDVIEDQLVRADIIITTGGLSYGGGDTVKDVMHQLGDVRFDNIAMSPGRQLGVGRIGSTVVYCLPGNPVSVLTNFEVFIRPSLRKMAGHSHIHRQSIKARVVRGWESPAGQREFVRARVLGNPRDGYQLEPTGDPRRPLLTALSAANCLAIVPESQIHVAVGEELVCEVLDR
ncbi:molybdopterin molybdenumtransferase MoeA [Arcanobacterium haemolyticum]|uniref:molybdopterin molybdotransferase MoeA n=1 Tax=Arcanobacterium haemolyticum TaxID=28264 RepID=UPI0011101EA3|nr:gephyrin-like molybdotransferase Glp [Arcanobacterium haemolyticum]QCX47327.1 molybdopterin molybdenumtransferase MoeA [Arcanobacterium haemolyticum]